MPETSLDWSRAILTSTSLARAAAVLCEFSRCKQFSKLEARRLLAEFEAKLHAVCQEDAEAHERAVHHLRTLRDDGGLQRSLFSIGECPVSLGSSATAGLQNAAIALCELAAERIPDRGTVIAGALAVDELAKTSSDPALLQAAAILQSLMRADDCKRLPTSTCAARLATAVMQAVRAIGGSSYANTVAAVGTAERVSRAAVSDQRSLTE